MATDRKRKHRSNIIVVSIILAVVAVSSFMALFSVSQSGTSMLTALAHASDGMTYRFPLDVDTSATIDTELGFNEVTVENGSIHVSESNCKNHDCIRQGSIYTPGQQIVCLPHEFYIEVIGEKNAPEATDSVSR